MSQSGSYEKQFPTPCNVSTTSLTEAAAYLGPAFVYELRANPFHTVWLKGLLKRIGADTQDNPLSPYINLVQDNSYDQDEWSLHANGKSMGTEGC